MNSFQHDPPVSEPSAPRVHHDPGVEYVDEARLFQGIPGVERASNGRLWAAWYGGGVTEDHHNYVMLATSSDDGETWSKVNTVIDPDGAGPERAFDPCLWHDPVGRLWLFFAIQGGARSGLWAMQTGNSGEEEPSWTTPKRLCDGIMMNKPIVLFTGEWLLPVAAWQREDSCRVWCSTDKGQTWSWLGAASIPRQEDRNCDEHMVVERRNGTLWMLVRTTYGIGQSLSLDRGKTWTNVEPAPIAHATTRFFIGRLASGTLLLVKHGPIDQRTDRSRLSAFLSDDDGQSWQGGLMIDERPGVSYPDAVQAPNGTIYLIYDYQRTGSRQILMATFTEEDVVAGKPVCGQARMRLVVNQATGKRGE